MKHQHSRTEPLQLTILTFPSGKQELSFFDPFSVLISAVSVAAQSKEVALAGCEGSPNSAKRRTSLVTKIFNTLPVSSCYLSQGIPGNRGKGKGWGKGCST